MKIKLLNFVALIGFVLLGVAVLAGVLIGVLFIFPDASIFGAKSVNERDTQIVYNDEILQTAFAQGKLILESSGAQIEVKISHAGYEGENTIVVNESANGIAFNSLNRTLIEWTQTSYNGDNGYYRIKVLEPSGLVFSNKPTTVYINLPYRDDASFRYNFVLQNHYSAVNFSFADKTANNAHTMQVNNLVVESAASVNFPNQQSINNAIIKSNNTKFTCDSTIDTNLIVTGNGNTFKFTDDTNDVKIEGNNNRLNGVSSDIVLVTGKNNTVDYSSTIEGNLTIKGDYNQFRGVSADAVSFESNNGSLNMSQTILSLNAKTVNAPITLNTVTGGVTMETTTGKLQVNSIGGGLTFNAGKVGNPNATASVTANKVTGTTTINNYGVGSIALRDVNGNVSINSCQVGGGNIDVSLLESSTAHNVNIKGYDGNINVQGLNGGEVHITVLGERTRAGAANIYAQFNKIGATTEIRSGGYVNGHDDWGNVEVRLANTCNSLNLYVRGARSKNCATKYGTITVTNDKQEEVANSITLGGSGETGNLKIYCQNRVTLA